MFSRRVPVRKLCCMVKVTIVLAAILLVISLLQVHSGGRRGSAALLARYTEEQLQSYERSIQEDEARIVSGLGDDGEAVVLTGEEGRLGAEAEKKLAMNTYLSDRIAYNRTLKDYRDPACKRVQYDAQLPSASVVIIFHNEPYSVVVRTAWSVLRSTLRHRAPYPAGAGSPGQDPNSPFVYLKEIILVDDNSTLPELKGKLDYYVDTRMPENMVRILRLDERVGLTRARLHGSRQATGDAIVFLDAHCEVVTDWLRPLLQRIADSPTAVVVPVIDVIESSTFSYSTQGDASFQVGGFNFAGHFTWIDVSESEKKRRGSDIAPTWSPTMAGGLFAINRNYFWEIGAYDEQMNGWGGENLEMSFRVWQCGGTLETVPCSRVGHVFRSFHPYGLPGDSDTHGVNTARMADVWMDEYAELFYLNRPDLRNNPKIGDVTHRRVLREKLKCKSFQWYLDNIYRDKFVPVRDVYGYGRFRNPSSGLCLDNLQLDEGLSPLGVYPCHGPLLASQYYALSHAGELRTEEKCAEIRFSREDGKVDDNTAKQVIMTNCHGKKREQEWRLTPSKHLQHLRSGLCLDVRGRDAGQEVLARRCGDQSASQLWELEYSESNNFGRAEGKEMTEQQKNLEIIRKRGHHRRLSRSITINTNWLEDERNSTANQRKYNKSLKKKSKNKKHKRTRNKFVLQIYKTFPNDTEDHLEVDIHCKHKQLYPNNTFVREIVTILNRNNIKVINNGRVFERNKMTLVNLKKKDKHMKYKRKEDTAFKKKRFIKKKNKSDHKTTDDDSNLREGKHHKVIDDNRETETTTSKPRKMKKLRREKKRKQEIKTTSPKTRAPKKKKHETTPSSDSDFEIYRANHKSSSQTSPSNKITRTTMEAEKIETSNEKNIDDLVDREDWPVGESRFRATDTKTTDHGTTIPSKRKSFKDNMQWKKFKPDVSTEKPTDNKELEVHTASAENMELHKEPENSKHSTTMHYKEPEEQAFSKESDQPRKEAKDMDSSEHNAKEIDKNSAPASSEETRKSGKKLKMNQNAKILRLILKSNLTFNFGDHMFSKNALRSGNPASEPSVRGEIESEFESPTPPTKPTESLPKEIVLKSRHDTNDTSTETRESVTTDAPAATTTATGQRTTSEDQKSSETKRTTDVKAMSDEDGDGSGESLNVTREETKEPPAASAEAAAARRAGGYNATERDADVDHSGSESDSKGS